MRRFVAIIAVGMLTTTACSDGGPAPNAEDSSAAASATTAAAPNSTSAPPTSVATSSSVATAIRGPTVTYDPDTPRFGGEVVIGSAEEPRTLNPFVPGGQDRIVGVIGQAHLSGAFDIDPVSLELTPELVSRIPTVSNGDVVVNDDGSMDVTWELRAEARWSDGTPVSGSDLEFTLDYQEAAAGCSELGVAAPALPRPESITVGDKSLSARFAVATLQYELLFRWVVPRHEVAESDYCLDWNTNMWPAAGPFVFDEWDRDGPERALRFTRNENYWHTDAAGEQLPYLDAVEFRFVAGTDELVTAFSNRRFDVVSPQASAGEIPVERWSESGADVQIVAGLIWEHINFQFGPDNRNPGSLNRFLDFRRAIAHGLDRRALLDDAGYPRTEVLNGLLSRFSTTASSQPWMFYEHDPDEARRLLAAACEQAGRDCEAEPPRMIYSTTANTDFRPAIAEQLAAQLDAIGIEVVLELEDSQLFFGDTVGGGTWDAGNWAWAGISGSTGIVDFFDRFDPAEPRTDSKNYYNWGTPGSIVEGDEAVLQFELLLDRMRASTDAPEIVALGRQAEELLANQVVVIPLSAHPVIGAAWADEIQGYQMNPSAAGHTWNIEHWYRIGD